MWSRSAATPAAGCRSRPRSRSPPGCGTGRSFSDALTALPAPDHARARLARAGELFDRLALETADAQRFLRALRGEGGLDEHFREYEQTFGGAEQVETEVLDDLTDLAAGKSLAQLATLLAEQTDRLRAIRDDENGVEITTVHRAKGRQWPTVIVFGCDEEQLPHKRSLEDAAAGASDAVEAERRVAYVAFTRAQQRLVILSTTGSESRFLGEAGFHVADHTAREIGRLTGEDDFFRPWGMPRLAAQQTIRSGGAPREILRSCRSLTDALNVLAHAVYRVWTIATSLPLRESSGATGAPSAGRRAPRARSSCACARRWAAAAAPR
jgi:hypothetical protein